MLLHQLHPKQIGKVATPGGGLYCSDTVTKLVLKMLAHCTTPSCISFNILSFTKVIVTNYDFIKQLPGFEFICSCRDNLSYLTKLLASDELARSPKFLEQHADGTAKRQKESQNNIVRISKERGSKHATLESCILSADENKDMVRYRNLRSFQTGRQNRW